MRMWWNGRHDSFRSYWGKLRGGSSPLIRTIVFVIILFAFFPVAVNAQQVSGNAMFKISSEIQDAQVKLNVQNSPTPTVVLTRSDPDTFILHDCTTNATEPGSGTAGYTIQTNVAYCDTSVVAANTYNYTATSTVTGQPAQTVITAVCFKVATGCTTNNGTYHPLFNTDNLSQFVQSFISWVVGLGIAIMGLMILFAGYTYIASQGNEEAIKQAKSYIISTLIGFITLMLITSIMRLLLNF